MAAPLVKTATPGIYKRGNRYVVVWRHCGKQHRAFYRTLAEAREAKGARQGPDRQPVTRELLEDYARDWIDNYAGRTSRGFSEQARSDYRRSLETYIIPHFAGRKLADVELKDVRKLVKTLEERGLAPASVVKNIGPLRAMFATALEDGLALPRNPCAGLRINRRRADAEEQPDKPKAMTREQLARLLDEIPERWVLLFELLAKTGLRISEALGLDWQDVEFGSQPRLRIRRQYYRGNLRQLKSTAGRRDLPLPAGLARRLWVARPAGATGPVFATRDGHRLQDRNLRRVLDRAGVDAELGWVHFHTFRHTFASLSFEAGKNIRQVSDWLGHTDPSFTLRTYVSLMDEGLGDADFLDEAVGTPEAPIEREGTQDAAAGGR